jgi:hypothetical protein
LKDVSTIIMLLNVISDWTSYVCAADSEMGGFANNLEGVSIKGMFCFVSSEIGRLIFLGVTPGVLD